MQKAWNSAYQTSDVAKQMIAAIGWLLHKAMHFSEVYGALQTGVVDGQEKHLVKYLHEKFTKFKTAQTETNHQLVGLLFMKRLNVLKSLSTEDRAQFMQIADDVTQEANLNVKASGSGEPLPTLLKAWR